jgi:hypothetical protein
VTVLIVNVVIIVMIAMFWDQSMEKKNGRRKKELILFLFPSLFFFFFFLKMNFGNTESIFFSLPPFGCYFRTPPRCRNYIKGIFYNRSLLLIFISHLKDQECLPRMLFSME